MMRKKPQEDQKFEYEEVRLSISEFSGYDPLPVAQEIVNLFARYRMPLKSKDEVFDLVDELLSRQIAEPVEVTVRWVHTRENP